MAATIDTPHIETERLTIVEELYILPLRDGLCSPRPFFRLRWGGLRTFELVLKLGEGKRIGIVAQKDPSQDEPKPSDLHQVGTVGHIHRILRTAPDHILVFCEGITRFRVAEFISSEPPLKARVELLEDIEPPLGPDLQALRDHLIETVKPVIAATPDLPDELQVTVANISQLGHLADFVSAMLPGLSFPERQGLLADLEVVSRLRRINELAMRELERVQLRQKIHIEARGALTQAQREFFSPLLRKSTICNWLLHRIEDAIVAHDNERISTSCRWFEFLPYGVRRAEPSAAVEVLMEEGSGRILSVHLLRPRVSSPICSCWRSARDCPWRP